VGTAICEHSEQVGFVGCIDLACRRQRVIGITQVLFGNTNRPTPIARPYAAVVSQVAECNVASNRPRTLR
jgi:hypothetical protein